MSNRTLDSDWSWDHDQFLLACRDEHPTPSYGEIGRRMTRKFGIYRTHAACLGRYNRILHDSEDALAAAQRHVRRKTYQDRVREVGDPYHPLPEWFREPTPVETNQARLKAYDDDQRVRAGGGQQSVQSKERDEHNARIARDIITGKFDRRVEQVRVASQKRIAKTREAKQAERAERATRKGETQAAAAARRAADNERHRIHRARIAAEKERERERETGASQLLRPVRRPGGPQKAIGLDRVAAEALPEPEDDKHVERVPKPLASRFYRPVWTD